MGSRLTETMDETTAPGRSRILHTSNTQIIPRYVVSTSLLRLYLGITGGFQEFTSISVRERLEFYSEKRYTQDKACRIWSDRESDMSRPKVLCRFDSLIFQVVPILHDFEVGRIRAPICQDSSNMIGVDS